jgi:Fe-S-cluster containining protein
MSVRRRLRRIYAAVPDAGCRGLCAQACAAVPLFPAERAQLSAAAGRELPPLLAGPDFACPLLAGGRCTLYADRPLICRLFGAVEDLRCSFGCRPARLLARAEAHDLMRRVEAL